MVWNVLEQSYVMRGLALLLLLPPLLQFVCATADADADADAAMAATG